MAECSLSIGNEQAAVFIQQAVHERPGHHERLLIGQSNLFAGPDGRNHGLQAGKSDESRDDGVHLRKRGRFANPLVTEKNADVFLRELFVQPLPAFFVTDHDALGPKLASLFGQQRGVIPGSQSSDAESIGK